MHLDQYGLPIQENGDAMDQLQRTGMYAVACLLKGEAPPRAFADGLERLLEVGPGIYTRHVGGDPQNVSADQLVPVFCYFFFGRATSKMTALVDAMWSRYGFAQNVVDGLGNNRRKTPDILFPRVAPIIYRRRPQRYIADLYLLVMAVSACIYGAMSKDNVDDNNTLLTFLFCKAIKPTSLSKLSWFIYRKFRSTNYGVTKLGETNNIMGALAWYHRAESGGNPEMAEVFRDLVGGK